MGHTGSLPEALYKLRIRLHGNELFWLCHFSGITPLSLPALERAGFSDFALERNTALSCQSKQLLFQVSCIYSIKRSRYKAFWQVINHKAYHQKQNRPHIARGR